MSHKHRHTSSSLVHPKLLVASLLHTLIHSSHAQIIYSILIQEILPHPPFLLSRWLTVTVIHGDVSCVVLSVLCLCGTKAIWLSVALVIVWLGLLCETQNCQRCSQSAWSPFPCGIMCGLYGQPVCGWSFKGQLLNIRTINTMCRSLYGATWQHSHTMSIFLFNSPKIVFWQVDSLPQILLRFCLLCLSVLKLNPETLG